MYTPSFSDKTEQTKYEYFKKFLKKLAFKSDTIGLNPKSVEAYEAELRYVKTILNVEDVIVSSRFDEAIGGLVVTINIPSRLNYPIEYNVEPVEVPNVSNGKKKLSYEE